MTLVDFFESCYDGRVARISAVVMLIAEMGWMGALLLGFRSIINYFIGVPLGRVIGVSTLVLIIYTCMSGMYAITLTDTVQMTVITV